MSVFSYEQATLFGALDSDAFADGNPLHAHLLRAMGMSGNRLTLKGQHLMSLAWVVSSADKFAGYGLPYWQRAIGPVPVFKKPWLNRMKIRMEMTITSGAVYQVGVGTSAAPFLGAQGSQNFTQFTGTGTPQAFDIEDIPISEDTQESIDLWVCACDMSGLADEGTYGVENRGTFESLGDGYMFDTAAAWNMSSNNTNLATAGHLLSLENGSNARLVGLRRITSVGAMGGSAGVSTNLQFEPFLTPGEIEVANSGGNYSIYKTTEWAVHFVGAAAEARTL